MLIVNDIEVCMVRIQVEHRCWTHHSLDGISTIGTIHFEIQLWIDFEYNSFLFERIENNSCHDEISSNDFDRSNNGLLNFIVLKFKPNKMDSSNTFCS